MYLCSASPAWREGCGRRSKSCCSVFSQTSCFTLTRQVSIETTHKDFATKLWTGERRVGHFNSPDNPAHCPKVSKIGDALVSKELGPRAVGRVREIVDRAFCRPMPTSWGLGFVLPKERIARIGVAKNNHVAGEAVRLSASARTCRTSGESGFQFPRSIATGERP